MFKGKKVNREDKRIEKNFSADKKANLCDNKKSKSFVKPQIRKLVNGSSVMVTEIEKTFLHRRTITKRKV